mgnify:CR=1 FL=1
MTKIQMFLQAFRNFSNIIQPVLIGFFFFFYIVGLHTIFFENIYWLIDCPIICDSQQHLIGWLFFRDTDLLQFPLLKNVSYGLYYGSSIIFTDSLPIFALFFRFFGNIIDFEFQYFGLWILCSFIMQAFFADKILRLYINDNKYIFIATLFFCISPIFLNKLFFSHIALSSHWIILASIYLYLKKDFSTKSWLVLIILSTLVHAYYIAFTSIVFLMSLTKYYIEEKSTRNTTISFAAFFSTLFIALYSLGYFILGGNYSNRGYGTFKMNLNSIFDPKAEISINGSSFFFKDLPTPSVNMGFGDYEGYNFLGTGIIFLLFLTIIILSSLRFNEIATKSKEKLSSYLNSPNIKVVIVFSLLIFIYSISNNIFFGEVEIFTYPLPDFTKIITKTFRSSGRFFWINYYLIYILVLITVYKYSGKYKLYIILLCFIVQFVDMKLAFEELKKVFYKDPTSYSTIYKRNIALENPMWKEIPKNYDKIFYVIPNRFPERYFPLAYFAAKNKMQTNFGYFARVDKKKVKKHNEILEKEIHNRKFSKNTLYVFFNDKLWKSIEAEYPNKTFIIDNYKILTP